MFPKVKKPKKLIYLDNAATTPLDPRVRQAMQPFWSKFYGNPSSLYMLGQQGKVAVEFARQRIAKVLDCTRQEIIFTAGGTESVNLAVFGVVREYLAQRRKNNKLPVPHIITSTIEHQAVLNSFKALEGEGVKTSFAGVDAQGFIDQQKLFAAIKPNTILISLIYANNEIGTVQEISKIAHQLAKINQLRRSKKLPEILLHTDACQAAGALDLNVHRIGADLISLNASKIYGPKQIGLLFKKAHVKILPLVYGGGQENDLRSGTENVPEIVGFGEALELAQKSRLKENIKQRTLRDYLAKKLLKTISGLHLNGPALESDSEKNPCRLPNNISLSISEIEGESLMLYLDAYNIASATGSACATAGADPSHVILALGRSADLARGTIRLTLGKDTKKSHLDYVLKVMPGLVKELRRTSAWKNSEDYLKKV